MHKNLIIGAGYLGARLAQSLCQNDKDVITTRTSRSLSKNTIALDINKMDSWSSLERLLEGSLLQVFFLIPPSKIEQDCLRSFLEFLNKYSIKRAVLSSSTVVYGSKERIVDADSMEEIESLRAQRQFDIEQIWLSAGEQFRLIRLAGLYGPDRVIGAKALMAGEEINSSNTGYLNLLHITDAVTAVVSMMNSDSAHQIELACDDEPVLRQNYYQEVAKLLGTAAPNFAKKDAGSMRQCNNKPTRQRLNWKPQYNNYCVGLKQALSI